MKKLIFLCLVLSFTTVKSQSPTWADHVACIIYSHCTSCHNPNGAAPFSLMTYTDAVNNASRIKIQVENKYMPPWPVDNKFNKVAHDRSLTDKEIFTITEWINKGKLQGNMLNAPNPPYYSSFMVISNPDLQLQIPAYTVPANITKDLYRCFVIPTGLSVQKFITGMEIIPGNRNIVHHAQIFYDTTGATSTLDAADPDPGYTSAGGVGTEQAVLLGTWVPGSSPVFVPSGMGKRLPPTAKIVIQIHYPASNAGGKTDSTKVNFLFTNYVVRNISDAPVLNHTTSMTDGPLFIPKNTVKTFHEKFFVPINATVLSIGPHGHLLCKSMKAYGVTLAGDTIPLINIPRWDFHWQGTYDFQKPIKIPIGTTLYGEATYDNTSANPDNPNNPPQDVSLGENTTDEMMLFYFSYLGYKAGDENIIVDTSSHKVHHNGCESNYSSVNTVHQQTGISVYPNPAGSLLHISANGTADFELRLFNSLGQLVYFTQNLSTIDLEGFPKGIYLLNIEQGEQVMTTKIVKE